MPIIGVEKLSFNGVGGKDIFNITAPFVLGDTYYILGRVDSREEEDKSVAMFFYYSRDEKSWMLDRDRPVLNLQDPFITKFRNYIILGGVEVAQRSNKKDLSYRTMFYRYENDDMKLLAHGPWGMKDIRFIELQDKTIAVFTRPQGKKGGRGKIGFTIIDSLNDLTPRTLSNAPLIDNPFAEDEWGGVNELHLLENGKIGVLGHTAKFIKDKKHYSVITFVFNPKTGMYTDMKIIVKRKDLPHVTPKREDLYNVVYPGGLIRNSDGTAKLYVGVGDTESYEIAMQDPFLTSVEDRILEGRERVAETAKNIVADYYDEGYFASNGKVYEEGGELKSWGYLNPDGWWEPAQDIAKVWKAMFNPSFVVDVGCGRGAFTKALRDEGVNAIGFDFSEFAVEHPCCDKKDIFRADVKNIPLEDNIADLTLVLDLCEHLYASEIDIALSEIARISSKWVFFNIGGIVPPEQVKMLKRGESIPNGYEGLVAAGHVTFQSIGFWRNKIESHGLIIRDDLAKEFCSRLPEEYLEAWDIIIARKNE